jgi:choline dehydrogenase
MFHVRGHKSSYDAWESSGANGWNFDTMLPFLMRSECAEGRDPAWRGMHGPLRVGPEPKTDAIVEAGYQAAVEVGYRPSTDGNGEQTEGVSWAEVNLVDGMRQSAADAYLRPALSRANLTLVTDAHAQRLLIEKSRCVGVRYSCAGEVTECRANEEVVLAGGAVGSAQLLLLSGIGPANELNRIGVQALVDLPGVGENLHDHVISWVSFEATGPVGEIDVRKPLVLLRSQPASPPDLQLVFVNLAFPVRRASDPVEPWGTPEWLSRAAMGFSVQFSLMTPASRGTLRLASTDPEVAPVIDPGYLSDPHDVSRLVAGLRLARELCHSEALNDWRGAELAPGSAVEDDAACRGVCPCQCLDALSPRRHVRDRNR